MRYFGGKSQTCKEISKILNEQRKEGQVFLSPFTGGGWVEQYVKGPKILNDKHEYLVALYKGLQEGWEAPSELSREEYNNLKENPKQDKIKSGFVGFGCSFAGKWFGGYANDKTGRNYCLNAKNSLERKLENGLLRDAEVKNKSYDEFEPEGMLIYCLPEGSLIYQDGKYKPIEEVEENYTDLGEGNKCLKKHKRYAENEEIINFNIMGISRQYDLKVSQEHTIFTYNKKEGQVEEKKAKDITEKDYLMIEYEKEVNNYIPEYTKQKNTKNKC